MPPLCSGHVQWAHGKAAEGSNFPKPYLLPTTKAHGGRQDPLPGQRAGANLDPATDGGQSPRWWPQIRRDGAGLHHQSRLSLFLEGEGFTS